MENHFCLVLVTCPTLEEARKISKGLVEEKLAACVNLVPQIESCYWWEGKVENAQELLLLIKTSNENSRKVEEWVRQHHSYTVAEALSLPIVSGNPPYLAWIKESVR